MINNLDLAFIFSLDLSVETNHKVSLSAY